MSKRSRAVVAGPASRPGRDRGRQVAEPVRPAAAGVQLTLPLRDSSGRFVSGRIGGR